MILFWTIYLLGVFATVLLFYYSLEHGEKITVGDITFAFIIGIFSWLSFVICIVIIFADDVVFTKK